MQTLKVGKKIVITYREHKSYKNNCKYFWKLIFSILHLTVHAFNVLEYYKVMLKNYDTILTTLAHLGGRF